MSENLPRDEMTTRDRVDYSKPSVIAGGLIVFVIILCCVPVFWFFLPFVLIGLVVLFLMGKTNLGKARDLGRKRMHGARSELEVDFSPGLASSLVMNDWGLFFATSGKKPVAIPWSDVTVVEERELAILNIQSRREPPFEVDLSQDRYYLAARSLGSKIPDKLKLLVDPQSGRSELLQRMEDTRFEFGGRSTRFVMDSEGVEYSKGGRMSWNSITRVQENEYEIEDSAPIRELVFTAGSQSFKLEEKDLTDNRTVFNTGYDLIKAILDDRIPTKVSFSYPPGSARERAKREFNRENEITSKSISMAIKSGKFAYLEPRFKHMEWLVDTFSLEPICDTRTFFQDYAEMLSRTNRADESKRLLRRAGR